MRKTERLRVKSDERRAVSVTFVFFLMGIVPDNPKTNDDDQKVFVLAVLASLRWQERPSGRAAVLMTACEKTLVDDIEDVGSGQVANSVLQVQTRAEAPPPRLSLYLEKPTHADPVRRFHLTLETIFRLTHTAKIELTLSAFARQGFFCIL